MLLLHSVKSFILLNHHEVNTLGKSHYLTRDYYDGFINDRVKYGSGKI